MTTTATLQRRLIRTKEAATYLSMSDWKLRRLIQEGTFPVGRAH
jgi:excisionase family DNA binding protein